MLNEDRVEAILFDLDGTLMDTDDQSVEKLAHWLERLRWPRPSVVARRLVMLLETPANAFLTLLDTLGVDEALSRLGSLLRRWRGLRERGDFRLIAGVDEMLKALNGRYRLAVVTTRSREDAEAFLDQHGLRHLFAHVVTRESTWRLKPHPAPVRHAAKLLEVPAERCVMVGDTTVDVRSARRAGAWAVAVLCGFGERKELERAGSHVILESTAHVASLLQEPTWDGQ